MTKIKPGKRENVAGPFKSVVIGVAVLLALLAVGGLFAGESGLALVCLGIAAVIYLLGCLIPDKTRITY